MKNKVYNFTLDLDWDLINSINEIEKFDANWLSIEHREKQSLNQLKTIATIRSVGASNRIEGNKLTNEEIDIILQNIDITKLIDRDSQEIVGYYEARDLITENYENINITKSNIKSLHNYLLKYSQKDEWHKGNFKVHPNAVEATYGDGKRQVIFQPTEADYPTEDAIQDLIKWYNSENEVHNLVKIATFVYEFLSIHPFQDGNGRLSRLLTTLLLLQNGYKWIEYISFEHEIEHRKSEYYRVLRSCQAQRPNEDISLWVLFFINALSNIQKQLLLKLEQSGKDTLLSPREKAILSIIQNYSGIGSSDIANKLAIPKSTVNRLLSQLKDKGLIESYGVGRATTYSAK